MNKKGLKILLFVFVICFSLFMLSACEMDDDMPFYGYFQHSFTTWETIQEPTCEIRGIQKRVCVICGEEQTRYIKNSGAHRDGEWRITKDPTCTEPGEETNYCAVCGEPWKTRIVSPNGHSFGDWRIKEKKTCTKDGVKARECRVCGFEETQPIPASHEWQTKIIKPATCTEDGIQGLYCLDCGETKDNERIPAPGHSFVTWLSTKDATCTEDGEETSTCIRCSEKSTRPTSALGHSYGAWVPTKDATCTEEGEETSTCIRCSEKKTKPTSALGHIDEDKDGYCDRCHEWVAPDEPIAVSVKIDDKISEYGKPLKTLTYTVTSGSIPSGWITLTKDPGDSVGSYEIHGSCSTPYYDVTFEGVGTYYIISAGLTFEYSDNAYRLTGYTGTATDVVIPGVYSDGTHGFKNVTKISDQAFWRCNTVETITLNENITTIGSCAFFGCSSLESITISASVEYIGNCAFSGCQSLTSATFNASGWKRIAASSDGSYENWEAKTDGISTDLSDAGDAAAKLVGSDQYVDFYFYR